MAGAVRPTQGRQESLSIFIPRTDICEFAIISESINPMKTSFFSALIFLVVCGFLVILEAACVEGYCETDDDCETPLVCSGYSGVFHDSRDCVLPEGAKSCSEESSECPEGMACYMSVGVCVNDEFLADTMETDNDNDVDVDDDDSSPEGEDIVEE